MVGDILSDLLALAAPRLPASQGSRTRCRWWSPCETKLWSWMPQWWSSSGSKNLAKSQKSQHFRMGTSWENHMNGWTWMDMDGHGEIPGGYTARNSWGLKILKALKYLEDQVLACTPRNGDQVLRTRVRPVAFQLLSMKQWPTFRRKPCIVGFSKNPAGHGIGRWSPPW